MIQTSIRIGASGTFCFARVSKQRSARGDNEDSPLCLIVLVVCHASHATAQDPEPLKPEWLAADFRSVELISLLASPSALTVRGISDILRVGDSADEQDLVHCHSPHCG